MRKFCLILAMVFVLASSAATGVFAAGTGDAVRVEAQKADPIQRLEEKKKDVRQNLKDGKMTREQADKATQRIDKRIEYWKELSKLSPQQKKDKLAKDFAARMDRKVQEGRVTREKADQWIQKYTAKLAEWDGNGFPPFHGKGCKGCGDKHLKHKGE